jgi:CHAT domain-containing protein
VKARYGILVLAVALANSLSAQTLLDLLSDKAFQAAGNKGAKLMESVDSVDFQFAVSVNENAGFFDIEQKGETWKQLLYQQRAQRDKTVIDIARDTLERGVEWYGIRRYEKAERAFLSAKSFMESRGLTSHIVYLRTLSNLGLIYLTQGRTLDAEKVISRTLTMSEQSLGKNSAAYVANLNNMARLHQATGKYNEAEKEFNEGLKLCDDVFGPGKAQALLFNNKAMLFLAIGRYTDAIALMNQALGASALAPKKKKILFQGEGFDNRKFQINLAFIQQISGDYPAAEASFRTIEGAFKEKEKNTAEYAGVLNQVGILYVQMGKMDKVEAILKASMEIYKKRYTENNIYTAKVMNDLGNFYRINARYADAEAQLTKALSIREALLGTNHPQYIRSLEDVAILYWKSGKSDKAYASYKQVMDKSLDFINRYFPPMSEAEKANYWEITAPRFQRFYNFALETSAANPKVAADFLNYNLATKALLLSSTNRIKEAIKASNDKQLVENYEKWQANKEALVKLYAYSKAKLKAQNLDLDQMERETNDLEKKISERSSLFLAGFYSQPVTIKEVSQVLDDGEAVVDIVRVKNFQQDFTADVSYVAMVLKKGMAAPKLVVLDKGTQLEGRSMEFYKRAATNRIPDDISYGIFWSKIDPELSGVKTVYFSPDGAYNKININTLKGPDGFLINKYNVVLLGNSKDIVRLKSRKGQLKATQAYLVGFPDYANDKITPLPGTKKEVEAISKLLSTSGYKVTQHLAQHATEENIKEASGQGLVHIATHGFFAPEKEVRDGSVFGIHAENATNNPLLRSGLIMASVLESNPELHTDMSNTENGVLTAYEAMNLNLTGTSLVVLSACETGLGEVKSGEGVYGLQRAFLVAGAETLIMSLWKVDDEATQLLMTNFYTNWLKPGNKQAAFKEAQLQLMTKFPEPYYWGAFVMVGN